MCDELTKMDLKDGEVVLIQTMRLFGRIGRFCRRLLSSHLRSNTFWITLVIVGCGIIADIYQQSPELLERFHLSKESVLIILAVGANAFKMYQNLRDPAHHEFELSDKNIIDPKSTDDTDDKSPKRRSNKT